VQLYLRHAMPVAARGVSVRCFCHELASFGCRGTSGISSVEDVGNLPKTDAATLIDGTQNCAEQLSRFFPEVRAVRIPVQITTMRPGRMRLREASVLEFSGTQHAIFLSTLPLEFADRVTVTGRDRSATAEASVVAVQYHEGRKAVAIRFSHGPCDWVTQAI
jgi:hypothetical protein